MHEKSEEKKDKDLFYFQEQFFENEDDFLSFLNKWIELPLDQESADRQLNNLKEEIIMNIFLRGIELNNGEFTEYLNRIFEFAMTELDYLNK